MADEMLRIAGRSNTGLAKAIQTDSEGFIRAKHANNPVEEVLIYDALVKRDTTTLNTRIDLTKYKKVTYLVYSTLDTGFKVIFRPNARTAKIWNGTEYIDLATTLTTSTQHFNVVLNTELPELNHAFGSMDIRIEFPVAPTSGDLTLRIAGVLR